MEPLTVLTAMIVDARTLATPPGARRHVNPIRRSTTWTCSRRHCRAPGAPIRASHERVGSETGRERSQCPRIGGAASRRCAWALRIRHARHRARARAGAARGVPRGARPHARASAGGAAAQGTSRVAETLILDAEAVHALAFADRCGALRDRARAILTVAHERRMLVRVPVPVLAEVCRSPHRDAAVDRILNGRGIGVSDLTRPIAQHAGRLLARGKLSSTHAVDAFVVATASQFARSLIATGDPADIQRLAASCDNVRMLPLCAATLRARRVERVRVMAVSAAMKGAPR